MTNYSARGNNFDLQVAKDCKKRGGLVASRRHTGGAGDLLVIWPDGEDGPFKASLIECKTAKRNPYEHFRKPDRQAMRDEGARFKGDLSLWLAWRKTGTTEIRWEHESKWPETKVAA